MNSINSSSIMLTLIHPPQVPLNSSSNIPSLFWFLRFPLTLPTSQCPRIPIDSYSFKSLGGSTGPAWPTWSLTQEDPYNPKRSSWPKRLLLIRTNFMTQQALHIPLSPPPSALLSVSLSGACLALRRPLQVPTMAWDDR